MKNKNLSISLVLYLASVIGFIIVAIFAPDFIVNFQIQSSSLIYSIKILMVVLYLVGIIGIYFAHKGVKAKESKTLAYLLLILEILISVSPIIYGIILSLMFTH